MSDQGKGDTAELSKAPGPRLSLVVPTTGDENSIRRVLGCIAGFGSDRLLRGIELIVFLNIKPETTDDYSPIERFVASLRPRLHSVEVIRTDRYYISAEESALAGVRHATGELLWIVGDKRIFTPEGMAAIDAFVHDRPAPCAYFNSVWYSSNGITNGRASTHMAATQIMMPYKHWVMRQGFNFMATAMGAWIYERHLLDLTVWRRVIETCGAHFSHVTTMLYGIRERNVLSHAIFAIQAEAKAYHEGDSNEWVRYAKLANTCVYYPWTLGIVRHFRFLIDAGVYRYDDIRRSMCSEALTLRRQVDEIYNHLLIQIRSGRTNPRERITTEQCNEIVDFLDLACPEKIILNWMFRRFHATAVTDEFKSFDDKANHIGDACSLDWKQVKLSSLIVGHVGACFVRLHPGGYLISPISDNEHFLLAYKLIDPPATSPHWTLVEGDILAITGLTIPQPERWSDIYPPEVDQRHGAPATGYRKHVRHLASVLYRYEWIARKLSALPAPLKARLRARLM